MRHLSWMLVAALVLVMGSFAFANNDFATLAEKEAFYIRLDNAKVALINGDELTSDQIKMLEDEGLINRDELDRTGGPDLFGYEFIDNEEPNGPAYDWVDITGTGTIVTGLADDNHVGPFTIGFDLEFYGDIYTEFYVQSNGTISFTDQYITLGNSALPNPTHNALIAWFWDDLNANNGGTVYYEAVDIEGQDALVLLFDEYHDYWPSEGWTTSEVIIFASGKVVIMYDAIEEGMDTGSCTVGIQNADGSDGLQYCYNDDPVGYPYAGLQIQFSSFEDASISGVVTDSGTMLPIENAEVSLYPADDPGALQTVLTNDLGEYTIFVGEEGTFDVGVYAPTYVAALAEDIAVVEAGAYTQDFALDVEEHTVLVEGYVYSADNPGTPVAGVTVTMPQLGEFAVTDVDGYFDLGNQPYGWYTFEISYDPAGAGGYHDLTLMSVEVNDLTMPLNFDLFEIMPVSGLGSGTGNGQVSLYWTAPDNHAENIVLAQVQDEIQIYENELERFMTSVAADERAKIQEIETTLNRLKAFENTIQFQGELDEINDFAGYRVKLIYEDDTEEILPDYYQGESCTILGLTNGEMYGFAVGADYGYGDEYIVFSDVVYNRPHAPLGGYGLEEVAYEWIEINPDNGGAGTVILDAGDDANSGMQATQTFEYFAVDYSQLSACSNGWISFLDELNNIGPTLPSTSTPNATIVGLNADTDCEMEGDELAIWMFDDVDNELIIVQFYVMPYSGFTEYRYSYQIVLDCATGTIQLNYQTADDWIYYNRGGALVGVENADGTVAYVYDMNNLVDEMSLLFTPSEWTWGNISGTVTSADLDAPVEGADITVEDVNGDMWYDTTDEMGMYEVACDVDFGPFTVSAAIPGFYSGVEENVVYDGITYPVVDFDLGMVPIEFTDDFEVNDGTWDVSPNNIPGDWEWGIPTAGPMEDHTADGENCWATVLAGNHTGPMNWGDLRGDSLWVTVSFMIDSEDAVITYWHWMECLESWGTYYAGYNVQVSADMGATWTIIDPVGGYTGIVNYLAANGSPGEVGFGGNTNGWELVAFNLGDYVGQEIMVMFHFGSYYGTWNHRYGVAIDDFNLHDGSPAVLELSATPWDDPVVVGPNGGSFRWDAYVENVSGGTITFDAWTALTLPPPFGIEYGPLDLFTGLTLPDGFILEASPNQLVPSFAPNGIYTYWARVGDFGAGEVWAEASFEFAKLPLEGVVASSFNHGEGWVLTDFFEMDELGVEDVEAAIPMEYAMEKAYPNPFNPTTMVSVGLPDASKLKVTVYNALGQQVATLANGYVEAGYHSFNFNAEHLASGIYFIHANVPGHLNQVQKVALMK